MARQIASGGRVWESDETRAPGWKEYRSEVETLQKAAGSTDAKYSVTISILKAGHEIFMLEEIQVKERVAGLERAITEVAAEGLPSKGVEELRKFVLGTHVQAFQRALSNDPPAAVEPLRIHVMQGARAPRARPRPMDRDEAK